MLAMNPKTRYLKNIKAITRKNPIINEVEFSGIKSNKLQEQIYKNLSLKNKSSFVEGLASKDLTNININYV